MVEIICPECGFSRDMPSERLPKHTVVAKCPRCACRFRFSAEQGVLGLLAEEKSNPISVSTQSQKLQNTSPETTDEDDALPPGAVILGKVSPDEEIRPSPCHQDDDEDAVSGKLKTEDRTPFIPTEDKSIRIIPKSCQDTHVSDPEATETTRRLDSHTSNDSDNPWLVAPGTDGWPAAFYRTMLRIMLSAPQFFKSLIPERQHNRALLFYLIVCIIETVMDRLWGGVLRSVLEPSMSGDPQLSAMLELLTPDANPFLSGLKNTALLLLQAYLVSGLLFLMYRLVAGRKVNFSIIFQVVTYSAAPHVLCVIPVLGVFVGAVWSIGCLVVGLRAALALNWGQTLVGLLPIVILVAASLQQILR